MLLVKIQQIFLACTIIISYINRNSANITHFYCQLTFKYDGHKIMKIDLDEKMLQRGPQGQLKKSHWLLSSLL